jgi:hypothetical protein
MDYFGETRPGSTVCFDQYSTGSSRVVADRSTSSRALRCLIFVPDRRRAMPHTKAGKAFTELILETFRFNAARAQLQ